MIHKALEFLKGQLKGGDIHLPQGNEVQLTAIVNAKGEFNIGEGNLCITVVNIEEERFLKVQQQREKRIGDQVQFANPEIKLNLLVMLTVNPSREDYAGALQRLSEAITFFQGISFFDKARFPELGPEIEQLSVDLYSLTLEQQNQLWGSIGAKYLPSVVYKVRLVIIDRSLFGQSNAVIKVIDNELKKIS
jgi:hypothetical protein